MLDPDLVEERQVLVDVQDKARRFEAVLESAPSSLQNRFEVCERLCRLGPEASFNDLVALLRIAWRGA